MVRISKRSGESSLRRGAAAGRSDRRAGASVTEMFESCIGCKWTLHVLGQIRKGVNRPGALERSAPGLTAKVLNERLAKLSRFGVIERTSYGEIPPRVEYTLTPFGQRFVKVLDQIEALREELSAECAAE
jgi:DNA-binding HxlR family transcriptional regulator